MNCSFLGDPCKSRNCYKSIRKAIMTVTPWSPCPDWAEQLLCRTYICLKPDLEKLNQFLWKRQFTLLVQMETSINFSSWINWSFLDTTWVEPDCRVRRQNFYRSYFQRKWKVILFGHWERGVGWNPFLHWFSWLGSGVSLPKGKCLFYNCHQMILSRNDHR